MKIELIEEKLNKQKPLKFKGYVPTNLNDAITKIINGKETFTDLRKKRPQCSKNRYRGVTDIYKLCKYYFPDTSLRKILANLDKRYRTYCSTTYQSVYRPGSVRYKDQYGLIINLKNGQTVNPEH